ncbi:MAG: DinB family protein [Ilumatobacteraceae bacterium]
MTTRIEPPAQADEKAMLVAFLDYYRASLILKSEGLTDEQARRWAVPPSDLNITGLIRHMSEVERHWFQRWFVANGAESLYDSDDDDDRDIHAGPDDTLADAIAAWEKEVATAREITATSAPDDVSKRVVTDPARAGFQPNMRWILIHMIEEYARHCGHADLVRECIDGVKGD